MSTPLDSSSRGIPAQQAATQIAPAGSNAGAPTVTREELRDKFLQLKALEMPLSFVSTAAVEKFVPKLKNGVLLFLLKGLINLGIAQEMILQKIVPLHIRGFTKAGKLHNLTKVSGEKTVSRGDLIKAAVLEAKRDKIQNKIGELESLIEKYYKDKLAVVNSLISKIPTATGINESEDKALAEKHGLDFAQIKENPLKYLTNQKIIVQAQIQQRKGVDSLILAQDRKANKELERLNKELQAVKQDMQALGARVPFLDQS